MSHAGAAASFWGRLGDENLPGLPHAEEPERPSGPFEAGNAESDR